MTPISAHTMRRAWSSGQDRKTAAGTATSTGGTRPSTSQFNSASNPQVKEKAGRTPFRSIKTMKEDAANVDKQAEEIKARYAKLFKV